MSENNNNDERPMDITEQPTGEYLALPDGDAGETKLNGTAHGASAQPGKSAKAAFWLTHLETEVSRLHAKWHSIDAEFKNREARIAELSEEIKAREATIAKLTAQLQDEAAALQAAGERLTAKDGEIAALADERRSRDERIAALATELADAEVAHKATRDNVERAQAEVTQLNAVIQREQAASAETKQRNEELLAEHRELQTKLQDLEIYINGRHDRWAELNAQLADYKDALIGVEKTVKARDAAIARQDDEKRELAGRILDLERQCAELAGRRKEREEAYDELQKKVAAHFAQTEQLKAEYASRMKEADEAAGHAVDRQRHIESLERGIKRRDETVDALTAEAEQNKVAINELTTAKTKLGKRVDELENGLSERSQQLQVLREDLRMSHEQLRIAQDQLSDRTAQLASTQENLDQKSRHFEQLTDELHAAQKDASKAHAELAALDAHAVELGRLRAETQAEAESLKAELAAQQELVASLETELRAKQVTADLLERNVERITDLGASLAALDEQMNGSANTHTNANGDFNIEKSSLHLADFVATLAADDELNAASPSATQPELLPMDLLLDDDPDQHVVDIGERTHAEAGRKLVITINGEAFDFPLLKKQMTIGRGHGSDIRIASHFVSRLHAKISTNGLATIIEDSGSKNGLIVNSKRVRRRVLRDGDVVNLGEDLNLRFVDATH